MTAPYAPDEPTMQQVRRALLTRRVGTRISVNVLRAELSAMGVRGNQVGAVFAAAAGRGWLSWVGTERSTEVSARGRRVGSWRREAIRPDRRAAA